ncbi:MAG: hypothetical protein E6G60_13370, partial [Actinobacteria bacterium]
MDGILADVLVEPDHPFDEQIALGDVADPQPSARKIRKRDAAQLVQTLTMRRHRAHVPAFGPAPRKPRDRRRLAPNPRKLDALIDDGVDRGDDRVARHRRERRRKGDRRLDHHADDLAVRRDHPVPAGHGRRRALVQQREDQVVLHGLRRQEQTGSREHVIRTVSEAHRAPHGRQHARPPRMPRPNFAGVRRCSPVDRRFWYALGAIVLVALGLRVAYVLTVTRHEVAFNDSLYYISEASLLAAGDGFVEPFAQITHPHKPPPEVGDHPPLTSIVLLPGAALDDTLFMRFEMVVLGLGVVVLTGLLGRRVGGNATGLIAAGIAAVYPSLWTNDGLLMSETLATLLTVRAVLLTYRLLRTRRWLDAVALGAVIALDALTRAEFALLFPLLVLPVLWSLRDDRRLAITLGSAALATSLVVVAPWIGYNMARFDKPTLLSTGDGLALAGANQPKTYHGRL